jgi:hypothetical protein
MHDVKGVLDFLGYAQLRPAGGDWTPLSKVNGRYGTTDDTELIRPQQEEGIIRLVDRTTGDELALARKPQQSHARH